MYTVTYTQNILTKNVPNTTNDNFKEWILYFLLFQKNYIANFVNKSHWCTIIQKQYYSEIQKSVISVAPSRWLFCMISSKCCYECWPDWARSISVVVSTILNELISNQLVHRCIATEQEMLVIKYQCWHSVSTEVRGRRCYTCSQYCWESSLPWKYLYH